MSLFAAWTSVVLGAARIDPPAAPASAVPEPRSFRLACNPMPPAAPVPARRLVAEPALVSTRTPLPVPLSLKAGRLCLEK